MLTKLLNCVIKTFLKLYYKISVIGTENLPETGPYVMIANHTSLLDPIVLYIFLNKKINFMAKEELFKNKLLASIITKAGAFPVNRNGNDIKAIKKALTILKNNEILGIFPQGKRMESAEAQQAKSGAVFLAAKTNSPVVPIAIKGKFKFRSEIIISVLKPITLEFDIKDKEETEKASAKVFGVISEYLEA